MKTLFLILFLTGCGKATLPDAVPSDSKNEVPASPTVSVSPLPTVTPIILDVHTFTKVFTPQPGPFPNKHFTATAWCVTYLGNNYCWDDGVHAVTFIAGTVGHYTYFGMCTTIGQGCDQDQMTAPIEVEPIGGLSGSLYTNIPGGTITEILNEVPVQVDCTNSNDIACEVL